MLSMTIDDSVIRVCETFLSIQGEGLHSGLPCYFIRLSGCDLRCRFCDTTYAFLEGESCRLSTLASQVPDHIHLVQITGGEPLLQESVLVHLMQMILNRFDQTVILLETGGHRSLEKFFLNFSAEHTKRIHTVMDVKLAGSGESCPSKYIKNFSFLKPSDEIKFVISDQNDFEEAVAIVKEHRLEERFHLLVSPVTGVANPAEISRWILESKLHVRLQLQLHKVIWGNDVRGV